MRSAALAFPLLFSLLLPAAVYAQDAAALANQQALASMQQQQQIQLQQAQTQMQLQQQAVNDQMTLVNQANLAAHPLGAAPPTVRQQPGPRPGTIQVRLHTRSRNAALFFTTDGWTPTPASTRYTGPLVLDRPTVLRSIAIDGAGLRSTVTVTEIKVPGAPPPAPLPVQVSSLAPGTAVPLLFTAPASSRGAEIGDKLPIALAEDLVVDGKVLAPRLSPVLATVTAADERGHAGVPGEISFAVHSVQLADGSTLPLSGAETLEGENHYIRANVFSLIPVVGLPTLLFHGEQAVIPQGATLTAYIAAAPTTAVAAAHAIH